MDTIAAEIGQPRINVRDKAAAYLELTKPRIAVLLVLTSAAGFYLGTSGAFDVPLFVHSMLAITLLALGVATLNQYWERGIDPLMERTASRPLPTKRVGERRPLSSGLFSARRPRHIFCSS
jgi:heme o synthase